MYSNNFGPTYFVDLLTKGNKISISSFSVSLVMLRKSAIIYLYIHALNHEKAILRIHRQTFSCKKYLYPINRSLQNYSFQAIFHIFWKKNLAYCLKNPVLTGNAFIFTLQIIIPVTRIGHTLLVSYLYTRWKISRTFLNCFCTANSQKKYFKKDV